MELFDIVNSDGRLAGYTMPRDDVHRMGLWHRTVHIWILNTHGELLLQKRSLSKEVYPGLWDISCAGHLSAGDDSYSGAIRELKEELGLQIQSFELQFLFTVIQHYISSDQSFVDNEITDVFLLRKDISVDSLIIDTVELIDVKFVTISELQRSVHSKSSLLAPHDQEYKQLFEILLKQ